MATSGHPRGLKPAARDTQTGPAVVAADAAPVPARGGERARQAPNPHGDAGACVQCHGAPVAGRARPIPADRVDALCLGCHDGVRARREPHPIGRPFHPPRTRPPAGWPLHDGLLGCLTCHDVRRACDASNGSADGSSAMLRDTTPDAIAAFCSRCHVASQYGRRTPHRMVDDEGRVRVEACLACHVRVPPLRDGRPAGSGTALIGDPITLCAGCHRRHRDFFEPGHVGVTATEPVLANLARFSQARTGRATGAPSYELPLSSGRRVVCHTCHNPHQRGVFREDTPAARGAMSAAQTTGGGAGVPLRLRPSELCYACHAR